MSWDGDKGVVIVPCAGQALSRYHVFTGQGFRLCSGAGGATALGTSLTREKNITQSHSLKSQSDPQQTPEPGGTSGSGTSETAASRALTVVASTNRYALVGADCGSPGKPECAPESHFTSSNKFLPHGSPHQRCSGVRPCTPKQRRALTPTPCPSLAPTAPAPAPSWGLLHTRRLTTSTTTRRALATMSPWPSYRGCLQSITSGRQDVEKSQISDKLRFRWFGEVPRAQTSHILFPTLCKLHWGTIIRAKPTRPPLACVVLV